MPIKVTLILFSYNHSAFLNDGIDSIIAQSRRPDEVILCDDASRDESQQVIAHRIPEISQFASVITIFNSENGGLSRMITRAFEAASGEVWILQAGDDEMRYDRIEKTLRAYEQSGATARSITSNAEIIDQQGHSHGSYFPDTYNPRYGLADLSDGLNGVLGATQSLHREVWDFFGPMPQEVFQEDLLLPFRAALLGKVVYIPENLVRYRFHGNNVHFAGASAFTAKAHAPERGATLKKLRNSVSIARQRLVDASLAQRRGRLAAADAEPIARYCADSLRDSEVELEVAAASRWALPVMLFAALGKGVPLRRVVRMAACYTNPAVHIFLLRCWIRLKQFRDRIRQPRKSVT